METEKDLNWIINHHLLSTRPSVRTDYLPAELHDSVMFWLTITKMKIVLKR